MRRTSYRRGSICRRCWTIWSTLEVVEAPGFTTGKERVDLTDAARRAAGILEVRARRHGIALVLPDTEEDVVAIGEFHQVMQILINLIDNAIAYSPGDSTTAISVGRMEPDTVAIEIGDEGPGIDPDEAKRVFDKFERLGRTGDLSGEGKSGLGLYISRRLARAMGGELELVQRAAGEKQRGATFRLTLPRA